MKRLSATYMLVVLLSVMGGALSLGLSRGSGVPDIVLPPGFNALVFADNIGFPTGLAYSAGGSFGNNLYVGDAGSTGGTGAILRFDSRGAKSTFASNITGPIAVAIDPGGSFGGDMHVVNGLIFSPDLPSPGNQDIGDGTIKRVKSDGSVTTFAVSGVDTLGNQNLAFSAGGAFASDLYATSVFPQSRVLRIKSDGSGSQLSLFRGENSLGPVGLAFGPGGQFGTSLFVSDPPTNRIVKVDSAGMATSFVSNVSGVVSLAFDRGGAFGGDLFAASFTPDMAGGVISTSDQGKILRIKPDGTFTTFASGLRFRSFFSGDIVFGFGGDLFVLEDGINRVLRITSSPVQGPAISVSPTSLDFGNVAVGQNADRTLTVSNTGNAALTVSSIASNNARFSVVSPNLSFTVMAAGQQTVTIRFSPNSAGAQAGTLTINSSDPNRPIFSVSVAGTGAGGGAPAIDVTPASLDFGSVAVGQSKDLTISVRNTGNALLTVSSMTSSNTQFSVTSPSTPLNVAAGAQQSVNVRFAPSSAGPQSGSLLISSNDPLRMSATVTITGTGGGGAGTPAIEVTQTSLDFGSVVIGQSKDLALTVRNAGNASLTVSSIVVSNTQFNVTSPSIPFSVTAGGQQTVNVRFAPSSAGPQSGGLAISSNDPARATVTVPISGVGGSASVRTLSPSNSQGAAGSTVSVPVNLSDAGGVSALRFVLTFDPSILSIANAQAVSRGVLLPANFTVSANVSTAGQVTILVSPPLQSPLPVLPNGSGSVAVIGFQVAPAAADGAASPLRLTSASGSDPSGEAVSFNRQDGAFTVRNILLGDVNLDSRVNEQDLVRLILHLTGESPLTGTALRAADTNCDGQVNEQDLVRLILHLTGDRALPRSCPTTIDPTLEPFPYRERTLKFGESNADQAGMFVPIQLDEGSDIAAAGLSIKYDPDLLNVVGVVAGDLIPKGFIHHAILIEPGNLKIVMIPPLISPIPTLRSGAGVLLKLRVSALNAQNLPSGIESLKLKAAILVDDQGRAIRIVRMD